MKGTKTSAAAAIRGLNERIPVAVELQRNIETLLERLSAEKSAIRQLLASAAQPQHTCAGGESAVLVEEERLAWNVDKLEKAMDAETFEQFCPRKPEGQRLRAMLEATMDDKYFKQLRACAKASKSTRLELREAAQESVGAAAV